MSNKTPSVSTVKTASAHSFWHRYKAAILFGAVVLLIGVGTMGVFLGGPLASSAAGNCSSELINYRTRRTLIPGQQPYLINKVDTPETRSLGLGGRPCMPPRTAMLFEFYETGQQCFWMKDMKFAIDIVWLNEA